MWPHKITLSRGHANFWLGVTCSMSPSCQAWWPWALWKWRYIFNLSCDLTWPLVERAICYVMDGSLSWKVTSLPGWWLLVMCKWRYIFLKFNFSCDFLKPCVWRIMQVCVWELPIVCFVALGIVMMMIIFCVVWSTNERCLRLFFSWCYCPRS